LLLELDTKMENKQAVQSVIKQKLSDDVKVAMKAGDKVKVSTLRLLLAAIQSTESARLKELVDKDINNPDNKRLSQLSDIDILGVIQKEIRQRQESIESFKTGNRPHLVAAEESEMAILQTYLPKQATRDEIVTAAKRIIAEVGAQGQRDKGKVMPKLVAEFKGKADGRVINEVVSELLKG
jgi:uncharacterized protein YqeY